MGYAYNITGPGGLRRQHFHDLSFQAEQRLTKSLVVEAGYFRNRNRVQTDGNVAANIFLTGDPNITVPDTTGALVPNPRVRQLYMEEQWGRDPLVDTNELMRLSAAWGVNLGRWFGRHRIAGLVERSKEDRLRRLQAEIVVDANNAAVANAANPEAAANNLVRRHYLTEGDFKTYYGGDPTVPSPTFTFNGNAAHSTYVTRARSNTLTEQDDRAGMLAAQSFWWHDRLVTTFGYRVDSIVYDTANQNRISDPNDPRVKSKLRVLNEWDFDGTSEINHYRPKTFTAGGVFHAWPRLSVFFNYSRHNGTPRLDSHRAADGQDPAADRGPRPRLRVMIDLLGDERCFFRAARYLTLQTKDAAITPDGLSVSTSTSLGGTAIINVLNALLSAGRITPAQFDEQAVYFNAGIIAQIDREVGRDRLREHRRTWRSFRTTRCRLRSAKKAESL
jgi:hypothetical protein